METTQSPATKKGVDRILTMLRWERTPENIAKAERTFRQAVARSKEGKA
jgi:hypothetical protein